MKQKLTHLFLEKVLDGKKISQEITTENHQIISNLHVNEYFIQ